jgi:hypothetical protein
VIAHLPDSRAVTEYLDHSRATLAVIIPPKWTEQIRADREAPIQVLLDGSDPNFSSITRGYITAFIDRYNQKMLVDFLNRQVL